MKLTLNIIVCISLGLYIPQNLSAFESPFERQQRELAENAARERALQAQLEQQRREAAEANARRIEEQQRRLAEQSKRGF